MTLAGFIIEDMDSILKEWEDFARSLPMCVAMDTKSLRDGAAQILETIAAGMKTVESDAQQSSKSKGERDAPVAHVQGGEDSAAQSHAFVRLEEGFTLPEMVAEYRALRATVIRRWLKATDASGEAALHELIRFNEGIDQAMTESIRRFSDKIEEARELFMGALAHDLRNPLHVILRGVQYLQRPETATIKHADMAALIGESGEQIQRMVEELLDVARTKLGAALPISPESIDAHQICKRAIHDVKAAHPDTEFQLKTSGDMHGVWDAARLQQMLMNLLTNAVHHGRPGAPVTLLADGAGDMIVMKVHNEGEPIPQHLIGHIFEPLVQASGRNSRVGAHAGLGLYIACSIARAHGGTIDVASSRTAGTVFTVCLPRTCRGKQEVLARAR